MRLRSRLWRIFPQTFAVGAQFGVVLVPLSDAAEVDVSADARAEARTQFPSSASEGSRRSKTTVEVATFRSDVGYSDGRHPDEVRFTRDPREDVQRRDFTINGMMLNPLERMKCWTLLVDATISRRESCAQLAIRNGASRRTSCACCAECASRRASDTRSIRLRSRPCSVWLRRFIRFHRSACAKSYQDAHRRPRAAGVSAAR